MPQHVPVYVITIVSEAIDHMQPRPFTHAFHEHIQSTWCNFLDLIKDYNRSDGEEERRFSYKCR